MAHHYLKGEKGVVTRAHQTRSPLRSVIDLLEGKIPMVNLHGYVRDNESINQSLFKHENYKQSADWFTCTSCNTG